MNWLNARVAYTVSSHNVMAMAVGSVMGVPQRADIVCNYSESRVEQFEKAHLRAASLIVTRSGDHGSTRTIRTGPYVLLCLVNTSDKTTQKKSRVLLRRAAARCLLRRAAARCFVLF